MKYYITTLRRVFAIALFSLLSPAFLVQGQVNVKFSVDVSLLIADNQFNPDIDRILLKGSFNGWADGTQLTREGTTNVYSRSVSLNANAYFTYKFFNSHSGAPNGGLENKPGFDPNGNRILHTGTNPIVLSTFYFDNADMVVNLTTDHFIFYCTSQDISALAAFSNKLETEYNRIVTSLQATITQKIAVYIYKNEVYYHSAIGWPEFPDWAVGSAFGKTVIQMASPYHAGSHTYNEMLQIVIHEFCHITAAWKATTSLPVWLNEGVATWYSGQNPGRATITNKITSMGRKPELTSFEDFNTFSNNGGYEFSYTIAEFITKMKSEDHLANFVGSVSYTALGYADKAAFQSGWHQFLQDYYVNTPPPAIVIGTIRRFGDNWTISYSPHAGSDPEGNPLTYIFTITSDGYNKTFTDTNHTGGYTIPRREFAADATYTVIGKAYDGIVYTPATREKTFSSANLLPMQFAFTAPASGQVAAYNTGHQLRISWSPTQVIDADGDYITDRIVVKGYGLDKVMSVLGDKGFVLVDSADLQPGRTYTILGERRDGFDVVTADSITFTTPGTNGISEIIGNKGIKAYPIPVGDRLTLTGEVAEPGSLIITIRNSLGQVMLTEQFEIQNVIERQFEISRFPAGIYFIQIKYRSGNQFDHQEVLKILKQ